VGPERRARDPELSHQERGAEEVSAMVKFPLYIWKHYYLCKLHYQQIREYVDGDCYFVGYYEKVRCFFCIHALDPRSFLERK
jgi:hypothetical protein